MRYKLRWQKKRSTQHSCRTGQGYVYPWVRLGPGGAVTVIGIEAITNPPLALPPARDLTEKRREDRKEEKPVL